MDSVPTASATESERSARLSVRGCYQTHGDQLQARWTHTAAQTLSCWRWGAEPSDPHGSKGWRTLGLASSTEEAGITGRTSDYRTTLASFGLQCRYTGEMVSWYDTVLWLPVLWIQECSAYLLDKKIMVLMQKEKKWCSLMKSVFLLDFLFMETTFFMWATWSCIESSFVKSIFSVEAKLVRVQIERVFFFPIIINVASLSHVIRDKRKARRENKQTKRKNGKHKTWHWPTRKQNTLHPAEWTGHSTLTQTKRQCPLFPHWGHERLH